MATNYTFAQAIKIMHEGTNTEAIVEITRRFPQLTLLVNTVLTKAGEDFVKLAAAFPDYLTANKMNSMLKKGTTDGEDEENAEDNDTEEKAEEKPARRRGRKTEKVQDDSTEEETESDDPYAGKSAMDLFKECKKRKIKAEPKKPAKFYADLLKKDDAAKAEDTEEDDWGDEEEVEEKPAKKGGKKQAKKVEDDDEDWDI